MILQALKEYYDRKAADPDSGIAPPGWEGKELPFLIVLDAAGKPVGIDDMREGEGRKKRAKTFLVPQAVKRTVGIAANLLWDNPEYALGVSLKGKPERVAEQHLAFCGRVAELADGKDAGFVSLRAFLASPDKENLLQAFSAWAEIRATGPFLSFRLAGCSEPVFRSPAAIAAATPCATVGAASAICLITGEQDEPERLHAAIKGVRNANSTGANIVGFNLEAFRSFGKEQGDNAPVGKRASFAYTTALNTLLGKDSRQKIQVGDATTVFWAATDDTFETLVSDFFEEPPKDKPDRLTDAVRSLYKSADTGVSAFDGDDTRFYVLGLAPNAARIAVRFWKVGTVAEMAARFRQHFDDTDIIHGPNEHPYLALWRLLVGTAALGKSENIPPNLAGDTMRAILEGLPYPATLLQAAVRRNRAEQNVSHARAALIKACINRDARFKHKQEEELTVSLDSANTNIGYRLGRLFAALERIQKRASPGVSATIRDRYYGAASGTPATVFGTLMRLKNHHLAKLENAGERINLERLLGEIMAGIDDFPAHLPIADQGRFAIGYYHQEQAFFAKKDTIETTKTGE